MPVRGRPERPRSSPPEGFASYGQGSVRSGEFSLGIGVDAAVTDGFDVRVGVCDLKQDGFQVGVCAADVKAGALRIRLGVSEVDGTENTVDGFSVAIGVGEELGYAGVPRVRTLWTVSLGQEVQRRGESLPVAE